MDVIEPDQALLAVVMRGEMCGREEQSVACPESPCGADFSLRFSASRAQVETCATRETCGADFSLRFGASGTQAEACATREAARPERVECERTRDARPVANLPMQIDDVTD